MEENNTQQPIDLVKIFSLLWAKRKLFFIVCPSVLVCTYLFLCTIPKYYKCEVELAPESSKSLNLGSLGSLSSLASSLGITQLSNSSGSDAITPLLYPDLIKSEQFIVKLFPVIIETKNDSIKTSYYDYLCNHQKQTILGSIISLFSFEKEEDENPNQEEFDLFKLTKQQHRIIKAITRKIQCVVDKKTNSVSITCEDQDPQVCAIIANEVLIRMQEFIIDYRTKKARNDFEYYTKLTNDARIEYEEACDKYAAYTDSHRSVTTQDAKIERDKLKSTVQLKNQLYNSMEVLRQSAESKVQENKPAFTSIRSAAVPYKPAGPRKLLYSVIISFVSFIILSVYVLVKKEKGAEISVSEING